MAAQFHFQLDRVPQLSGFMARYEPIQINRQELTKCSQQLPCPNPGPSPVHNAVEADGAKALGIRFAIALAQQTDKALHHLFWPLALRRFDGSKKVKELLRALGRKVQEIQACPAEA